MNYRNNILICKYRQVSMQVIAQTQAYLDYTFKPHLLDFIYIKDNIECFLLPYAIETAFPSDILHPKYILKIIKRFLIFIPTSPP